MPIDATIDFPQSDVDRLFAQMRRAEKELGKSQYQSLQWGGRLFLDSIKARTKQVTKKKRRVIMNPDTSWHRKKPQKPFGVMGYKKGNERFIGIKPKGDDPVFFSSKANRWFRKEPDGKWREFARGKKVNPSLVHAQIRKHPSTKIPRRGFAKLSWVLTKKLIGSGGAYDLFGFANIGNVSVNKSPVDPQITIKNRVEYMSKAVNGGMSAIGDALNAAGNKMAKQIEQKLAKKLGAK